MPELTTIRYEIDNRIARVTFNRPEIHNAFNSTVISEMQRVFDDIAQKDDLRVVIFNR